MSDTDLNKQADAAVIHDPDKDQPQFFGFEAQQDANDADDNEPEPRRPAPVMRPGLGATEGASRVPVQVGESEWHWIARLEAELTQLCLARDARNYDPITSKFSVLILMFNEQIF